MSLFENDAYRWRETYFVLFDEKNRPAAEKVRATLQQLDRRYEIADLLADEHGRFEALTLFAPEDFAAMDIVYLGGEDAAESADELREDLESSLSTPRDRAEIARLAAFNARFDIYHFEQLVFDPDDDGDEEHLDPGSLLIVLQQLARLCHGVGVDPQSGLVM